MNLWQIGSVGRKQLVNDGVSWKRDNWEEWDVEKF